MIPFLRLSFAHLRYHLITSLVVVTMIAVASASVIVWISLETDLLRKATSESSRVDAVVGAKGSPLQLVLSTVYHMDAPTGNIPLSVLQELDSIPGIRLRVPVSIGDAYSSYRIVGTSHEFLNSIFDMRPATGTLWQSPFEAVIGATVAHREGLALGSEFVSTHGLGFEGEAHDHSPFVVVGILPPTSSILDDLILTSLESVWLVHDHDEEDDHHDHDHHHHQIESHADTDRQITAILIRFSNPYARFQFTRDINEKTPYLAASPLWEINKVLTWFGLGFDTLRLIGGALVCLILVAVMVILGITMKDRMLDIALLLNSGYSKRMVIWIPLVDSLMLVLAGIGVGIVMTVGAIGLVRRMATEALPMLDPAWMDVIPGAIMIVVGLAVVLGLASAIGIARKSVPALLSRLAVIVCILMTPLLATAQTTTSRTHDDAWRTWAPLSEVKYELRRVGAHQVYWPVVSEKVKEMHGQTITVRGYLILQLAEFQTRQFYLSKVPESQCYFCGGAGPESLMEVWVTTPVSKTTRPVTIRGRLEVNTTDPERTMYSLVDAVWIRD